MLDRARSVVGVRNGAVKGVHRIKLSPLPVMAEGNEVSHGDILYKIGGLEGKIDTIARMFSNTESSLNEAFKRIGDLEKRPDPTSFIETITKKVGDLDKRVGQGVILLVAAVFIAPLLWQSLAPRLHLGVPAAEAQSR